MADSKVTALTELTGVAATDILYVVDDPGGTPISKKATVDNVYLASQAYGNILVTGGSAAQSLTAATPAKLTLFTADGPSLNTTPAHASDQITVSSDGVYKIEAQFSMTCDTNSTVFQFYAAVGGVSQNIGVHRKVGTGADVGSASFVGHLSLSASDVITINVEADKNVDLTLIEAQLVVSKIG